MNGHSLPDLRSHPSYPVPDPWHRPVGGSCPAAMVAHSPQRCVSRTPVTTGIVVVTVAIHLLSWLWPPLWEQLFEIFALANRLVTDGQWWRMFTVTLLHSPGVMHVAFNMLALYNLGPQVEKALGPLRFGFLWGACAVAGSAFSVLGGDPDAVAVGASGAVFGLLGVWLASAVRQRRTALGRSLLKQLGFWLLVNAALPLIVPNLAWEAHLGGLLAGFGLGSVWRG
ncbi:MAG: rhomboid family intramembrane serine protease [Cyanobacteria bacterium MAG IRC1_bin_28]|nr:rhomboid family intramembrane serine protease [Cyanobacteria bacterium MAG IRC1_bin_28]